MRPLRPLLGKLGYSALLFAALLAMAWPDLGHAQTRVQLRNAANTAQTGTLADPLHVTVDSGVGGSAAPFVPDVGANTATLAVTTSSARVALPGSGLTVILTNNGASDLALKLTNSSGTAATTDFFLGAGRAISLDRTGFTHVAAITPAGSSSLVAQTGTGTPVFSGGGGSGATGTFSNASSGVATSSTNQSHVAYNYCWNGTTWDQCSTTTTAPIAQIGPYPSTNSAGTVTAATPETCASGNVANATVACTLAASGGKTTYISGFTMTASGATSGLAVSCTLTNTITGTMTYTFVYPAGVLVPATPLRVTFSLPVPATGANTTIVASCPASGSGGTNAAISAEGFQL